MNGTAGMQAGGTEMAPAWSTPAGFHSRAAAVFGSLPSSALENATAAPWSLSKEQVFKAGRADDYGSSDEEEDAKETERRRTELLPAGMLELDAGGAAEEDFQPSTAFCRALDNEGEYDENDHVAMGGSRGPDEDADARPAADTEVLDDNPYAQRSRHQAASSAGPMAEPMEVEEPAHVEPTHMEHAETVAPAAIIRQQQQHQNLRAAEASAIMAQPDLAAGGHGREHAAEKLRQASSEAGAVGGSNAASTSQAAGVPDVEEAKRGKKKVRFQEPWAPPHRREGQPPRAPAAAGGGSVNGHGRPQRGAGRSYVPDHVRNPHKYTCYALEEPLTVGGGGDAAADGAQAEMEQAQRAAHSLAAAPREDDVEVVEQMQHLPEFGSGIGFCPTGKRSRDSRPAAAESAAVASSAAALQQRFVEEEEVLQDEVQVVELGPASKDVKEGPPTAMPQKANARKYRNKAVSDD